MSMNPTGYWQMWCFNALSREQREQVVIQGYLDIGWQPEKVECAEAAELEVETVYDAMPGPRFYCIPCAIKYLEQLRRDNP